MRYAPESEIEPKLVALLDAAQGEAVFIARDQQEIAVLVSVREYGRLNSAANMDFKSFCDSIADKATASGLTESKLNDLLSNA